MLTQRPSCVRLHAHWVILSHSGILVALDGYMNLAIEQTEEYVNGQLKAKYADTFIRGNNGTSILCSVVFVLTDLTISPR